MIEVIYDGNSNCMKRSLTTPFSPLPTHSWYQIYTNNHTSCARVIKEQSQGGAVDVIYTYTLNFLCRIGTSLRIPGFKAFTFMIVSVVFKGLQIPAAFSLINISMITGVNCSIKWNCAAEETVNFYIFTGKQWDQDLEVCFQKAGYLNMTTGCLYVMDTFEGVVINPIMMHKYLYSNMNPAMHLDLSGNV